MGCRRNCNSREEVKKKRKPETRKVKSEKVKGGGDDVAVAGDEWRSSYALRGSLVPMGMGGEQLDQSPHGRDGHAPFSCGFKV